MLSESTTTTGDSLPVIHISPFHIMRADVSIKPERDHQKKSPPLEHQVVISCSLLHAYSLLQSTHNALSSTT